MNKDLVILDKDGNKRDWAWLQAEYGNVRLLEAAGYPRFKLVKIEETEGVKLFQVSVLNKDGIPHSGQPVCLTWPTLANPSLAIPEIGQARRACTLCVASCRGLRTARRVTAWGRTATPRTTRSVDRTVRSCFQPLGIFGLSDGGGLADAAGLLEPERSLPADVPDRGSAPGRDLSRAVAFG